MKVGCMYEIRRVSPARLPGLCFRSGLCEFEEKRLRAVLYGKMIVERLEVVVEATGEGTHGQIDAVGGGSRRVRNGYGGCIERQGLALNTDVSAFWHEEKGPYA